MLFGLNLEVPIDFSGRVGLPREIVIFKLKEQNLRFDHVVDQTQKFPLLKLEFLMISPAHFGFDSYRS